MNVLMIIGAAGGLALAMFGGVLARAYWRERRLDREWKRFVMDPVRPLRRRGMPTDSELRALSRRWPCRSFAVVRAQQGSLR